ncbi:hypothetical protein C0J52_01213 [Blattella germanica]|nr:hypothetical protein C0J52_01213 [Blattella germanica]
MNRCTSNIGVPSHYDSNNTDTENVLIPKSSVKKIGENNETKSDSEKKPNKGKSIGTNVLKIQANQHNSNFEKNGNKQNNILHHKNISQRWRVHNMTKNHLTRLHNMTKKNFMETLNRNLHSHSHYPEIENQSSESQVFITHNDWESRIKHRYERSVKNKRNHRLKRHHKFEFHHVFNHGSKLNNEDNNEGFKSSDDHVMPNRLYEERHEEEKTIKNHTIIRRLLSLEQPQFQIRNSKRTTDFEVQKVHLNHWLNKEKLSSELRKLFMQKKVEYIFSMTYGVILLVSVLCEVFSRAVEIASNQIVNRDESPTYNGFQYHFSIKADSQQIWKLISWGFLGCPLLALLVVMTKCSYQPRIFLLLPCLLTIIAVLTVWFCLKIPDSIWEWKLKDYEEELTQQDTTRLAKFGYYISILVAGFAMACNLEYILWYMDTLDNFTYNYQILYCGYVAVGAIFQAVTKSWLLKKQMKVPAISQDCMNADVDIARGDGFWSIGPILLGLHFLVASLLQPAWCLLLLGCLQGMSAAFLVSAKISIWWAAGYGLGSLFGGFMVELYSADWLFWIMAGSMFVWSAVITLCGGHHFVAFFQREYIPFKISDGYSYEEHDMMIETSAKNNLTQQQPDS